MQPTLEDSEDDFGIEEDVSDDHEKEISTEEKEKKEKDGQKKKEKFNINIIYHRVPINLWKNKETGEFDRPCIRAIIKLIFIGKLNSPCQLKFYSYRVDSKAQNSIIIYASFRRTEIHHQCFRFEIFNLENAITSLKTISNCEMLLRHNESDKTRYEQVRNIERNTLKTILKHRSAWKYRQELVTQVDREMWDKGHPQNLTSLNVLHKIISEINKETSLELKSKDLQDVFQICLKERDVRDCYLREATVVPLRTIMYSRKQVELLISDKGLKIGHIDSTSSIASKP